MDRLLLCGFNHWFGNQEKRQTSVALVVDFDYRLSHLNAKFLFEPWSDWLDVRAIVLVKPWQAEFNLPSHVDSIFAAAKPTPPLEKALAELEGQGVEIVRPVLAPRDTWQNDAQRELATHDYEGGGLNEWNGQPTIHGPAILRLRSRAHSRLNFPQWAFEGGVPDRKLKAMDLGCGPISHLRWGARLGLMDVTMVDPLLPVYQISMARHTGDPLDLDMLKKGVACMGEDLSKRFAPGTFDFVFSSNSLDHTLDPSQVIDQIRKVLKPRGLMAIGCATREGTRQKWDQFHKTDIYLDEDGQPAFNHKDGPQKRLLAGFEPAKVIRYTDEVTVFTAVKS